METPHPAKAHPNYVGIFIWLTAFTIIEVAFSYLPTPEAIKIAVLVAIAIIKAALVVLYFMHLRYDSRWYAVILLVGIFFAVLIGRILLVVAR